MNSLFFAGRGILYIFLLIILTGSGKPAGADKFKYPEEQVVSFVRHTFYGGIENSDTAKILLHYFESGQLVSERNQFPFLLAFYGATETLIAKHSLNPYTKLKYLQTGLAKIADALKKEPNNIEIRFLRYTILYHIPSILGYGDERDEDAEAIITLLKKNKTKHINNKLVRGIYEFMLKSSDLTASEKKLLSRLFASLG